MPESNTDQINRPDGAPYCFAGGTQIATIRGEVAVEELQIGDVVLTMDSGFKPIQWIGRSTVNGMGEFAPIRFSAGAVGNVRDLLVSPMHRILMRGDREVLISARDLVDGDQVTVAPMAEVEYFHILFDQHEVVFSDGAATESFYPSANIVQNDAGLRRELMALFPELFAEDGSGFGDTARRIIARDDAVLQHAA